MTLNKTKIEWCDDTGNPVTGCLHQKQGVCKIPCYASKISMRFHGHFNPEFHPERLKDFERRHTHSSIFVCSMSDLFGNWVKYEWQKAVFDAALGTPWHTYLFLTKNPEGMLEAQKKYYFSDLKEDDERDLFNAITWWGTSVTGAEDAWRIDMLKEMRSKNCFISFEPLLSDPGPLDLFGIRQVIIGAQTNPSNYVALEWVMKICEAADRAGAKVFMKDSLAGRWPDRELRRELCWTVRK